MRVKRIRQLNALYLADVKYGRAKLAEKLGHTETNQINQAVRGFGSFGDKFAAQFEDRLGLGEGWMDTPHPALWRQIDDKHVSDDEILDQLIQGMSTSDLARLVDKSLKRMAKGEG
jgi:hypothetical protein